MALPHRGCVALLLLLAACHRRAGTPPRARGAAVTRSLATSPDTVVTSLLADGGNVIALLREGQGPGYDVTLVRISDARVDTLRRAHVPSAGAVSNLVATHDGPAFALAAPGSITVAYVDGHPDRRFPHGEAPRGRDEVVPSIALAEEPDGTLDVLAEFGPEFGARVLHTRDVGESRPLTPQRLDTFRRPAIAIVGDDAVVVQQHAPGTFRMRHDDPTDPVDLELVAIPADPDAPHDPEPVVCARGVLGVSGERVTAIDPSDPARGVAVVFGGAAGVRMATAQPAVIRGAHAFRIEQPLLTFEMNPSAGAAAAPDVVATPNHCGLLAAWIGARPGAWVAEFRRVSVGDDGSLAIASSTLRALPFRSGPMAVRLATVGQRVVAVTSVESGVDGFEVVLDASCSPSLRPLAGFGAPSGWRLVGLVGDDTRALLVTARTHDGRSEVAFAQITPDGAVSHTPAPITLDGEVRDVALHGPTIVLGSRTEHGVVIHEVDGADEDLTIVDSRGEDFMVAASARHRRVWVAEAGGTGRTEFGPAQSVILHSVISTLQDGPRTETWLGVVPYADFDRITLSAPMIHTGQGDSTWWAPTFSVPRDAGQGCLAGGFAMMITQGHGYRVGAPPGRDPAWPGTGVLIDRENRRCDDRVGSALWNGEFYAITVSGPSAGARWLAGRWASSPTRSAILADATGGAIPTAATRLGTGYAAAWIEPDREAAHVRVQRFTREGERTGPVIEVARVSRVQAEGLAIASPSAHEIDVAYPTDGGPALTRVEVGE